MEKFNLSKEVKELMDSARQFAENNNLKRINLETVLFTLIDKYLNNPDDYSVEGIFGSGSIYWDLSEEFEPLENCPKSWKEFNVSGLCKDGETLDARIIQKNGKILTGKVMVEVR